MVRLYKSFSCDYFEAGRLMLGPASESHSFTVKDLLQPRQTHGSASRGASPSLLPSLPFSLPSFHMLFLPISVPLWLCSVFQSKSITSTTNHTLQSQEVGRRGGGGKV